jgi:Zn-dependent M28 family amino/carboxypeptidase
VAPPAATPFSGARALDLVEEQVLHENGSVRYRVPGTAGNDEAAAIIAGHLEAAGWNASYDRFNASYRCRDTPMHNVVGERAGTSGRVVILGAHYDTRPIAESDADPANRTRPIPGANDGASGVAVLLELARVALPTNDTLRLVFFDGEDGGDMGNGCQEDWILGSRHYAETIPPAQWKDVRAMVLVDLVGDPDLVLPKERLSMLGPGADVQRRIYEVGAGLGYGRIFTNDTRNSASITDDHRPFLDRQMPAVDLLHLVAAPAYFPEWHHTQHDDLAHVSAASLEAVGRTLQTWLATG